MVERTPLRVTGLVRNYDHGCDWWRLIEPFELARDLGHECYCAIRGHRIVHPPDIIVFRGEFFAPGIFDQFMRQCEADKVLVVYDYDDLYEDWKDLEHQRPASFMGPVRVAQRHALETAPLVTTTTRRLAEEIVSRTGRGAVVIPNAIKLDKWQNLRAPDPADPVLAIIGGDSHSKDWAQVPGVIRRLAADRPDLRFRVAGHDPGWVPLLKKELGDRFSYRAFVPFDQYPTQFEGATIVWAPLADTVFNECKSPIRHFESAAAGAAFIGSGVLYGQTVNDGENGYLADNPDLVWARVLGLCESESERSRLVSAARQTARAYELTESAVNGRFDVYYQMWQEVYGDGTGTSNDLWTPEGGWRGADPERRYRAVLPRDGAQGTGERELPRKSPALDRLDRSPLPEHFWTPGKPLGGLVNGRTGARIRR